MRRLSSALLAATLLALPATARADDEAKPIELSGFVDTSLFIPLTGFPESGDEVLLGLDQVELDVTAQILKGLKMRADLNWFPASAVTSADDIVEQGFMEVTFTSGLFLVAGKMNAPIGTESVDAPDMYTFSHSPLFDNAAPTNLTGFFLGWSNDSLKVMAWATNDWDTPSTARSASAGGRVEYGFGKGHVGVSSTYGPFSADDPNLLVDLDVGLELDPLKLWLNGNFGSMGDDSSIGVSAMANYGINAKNSVTARVSYLDREYGSTYKGIEVTGAWLLTIVDNLGAIVEVRADIPDEGDTTVYGALELTGTY